ncbi:MAG: sigma-54 dependent transcriptional regulator [Planctomycetota bacterium]
MTAREVVLLADDEAVSRDYLAEALRGLGLDVRAVEDGDRAFAALQEPGIDYVFTDLEMPGRRGIEVLAEARRLEPDRPVVLVTAYGTMEVAVKAMREGADDILEKPVSLEELELALMRVRKRSRLLRENRFLRAESVGGDLIVAGAEMRRIVLLLERVAPSKATVLIRGESGTGKERLAALVHRCSDRAQAPFVKINCAAIPENLLESELFGHEQGAFTGATRRREGRFEVADGGTLFLDEIGEMSPAMQAKLLRVLQEGEFQRVGGNRTIRVDVRIVAATNRDLANEVRKGRFREDLFYRLDVVPVTVPPLRQRREEILPLARHFLRKGLSLDPSAEEILVEWPWPGNVRELQNVIERASLLCEGDSIDGEMLAEWLSPGGKPVLIPRPEKSEGDPFEALVGRRLDEVESELISRTLRRCNGNRTKTAEMLGIGVRTLFNRLARKSSGS